MKLALRPVEKQDWKKLQDLSIKTFTDAFADVNTAANMNAYTSAAFNKDRLEKELGDSASQFHYCLYDHDIIGYMKLNFAPSQSDLNDPDSLELERIYVLKEHQNKKAGQFMIGQAVSIASQNNLKYIWLGVWEHNAGAIKFYEKNGFVRTGEHSFMLGDEEQTDLIMKRTI